MGMMMVAVVTLEATWVRPQARRVRIRRINLLSRLSRLASWSPIQSESPEVSLPAANAKPPPKRRMMPQGIRFSTKFQVIRAGEGSTRSTPSGDDLNSAMKFGLAGRMKRKMDIRMAGVASLLPGPPRASDQPVKNPGDLEVKSNYRRGHCSALLLSKS